MLHLIRRRAPDPPPCMQWMLPRFISSRSAVSSNWETFQSEISQLCIDGKQWTSGLGVGSQKRGSFQHIFFYGLSSLGSIVRGSSIYSMWRRHKATSLQEHLLFIIANENTSVLSFKWRYSTKKPAFECFSTSYLMPDNAF